MGIRSGLKIRGSKGHVGSSPTPGIVCCAERAQHITTCDRAAPAAGVGCLALQGRAVCDSSARAGAEQVESPSMSATRDAEQDTQTFHGGRLVARRLKAHGVSKLFTLSGGHLFSIYDGCRAEGIEIVDVRHESTAAFAAEGWAKVTREAGVCALTAGPGVTNGMSAMASAQANHSPMVVLGGRAPAMRWGQGSLQEIDHVPFVRPLTKFAATAGATEEISPLVDMAFDVALEPHGGPTFVDFPLDYEAQ